MEHDAGDRARADAGTGALVRARTRVAGLALCVAAATAACHTSAPTGFGVDLTVQLAPSLRSNLASVTLQVGGDESYAASLPLSAFQSDQARVQYVPRVHAGTLTFEVDGHAGDGSIVAFGRSAVTLVDGKAVSARIDVAPGTPPAQDTDDMAMDTAPDLASPSPDDLASPTPADLGAPINDLAQPLVFDLAQPIFDLRPPPDLAETYKTVFVSSALYNGNLGGFAGGDAKCQQLAQNAGLRGTYKAWLGDGTDAPATRFVQSSLPYRLVNGTTIANNWADLVKGTIAAPINKTETGGAPPTSTLPCTTSGAGVFTSVAKDGTSMPAGQSCSGWTTTSGQVAWGDDSVATGSWSYGCVGNGFCSNSAPIYCFEQ